MLINVLIFLLSCKNESKKPSIKSADSTGNIRESHSFIKKDNIVVKGEDIKISVNALSFYKWYIDYENGKDSAIILNISKGENGKCKLVKLEKYMNSLKSLGTLSENFINFENNRLTKCKLYIENYDWDKFNTSTIYEVTDDTPCSCFTYNYWYKSQEIVDEARIMQYNRRANVINVKIGLFTSGFLQEYLAYERLIKVGNQWLIDKIELKYE